MITPHLERKSLLNLSRQKKQILGFIGIRLVALITVLPIVGIVVYILVKGASAINWEFLSAMPRDGMRAGGILPAIVGTFYLMIGTAIFSIPLGIAAGIYLSEYAPDNRWTRLIRIAIISLAGVPSVVYGLFGLGLFVLFFDFGISILSASLTLSIMTLPVIISTTEESLRSVPYRFRVVGVSLGGTQWQTIRRVILPQALPGILTGIILGLERSVGETAPILFTGRNVLPPAPTILPHGRYHGPDLSYLCYFHAGTRYALRHPVRHRAGAAGVCAGDEFDRVADPRKGARQEAMVND